MTYPRDRSTVGRQAVHITDELPKNASGKLLKRELREHLSGNASVVARAS